MERLLTRLLLSPRTLRIAIFLIGSVSTAYLINTTLNVGLLPAP